MQFRKLSPKDVYIHGFALYYMADAFFSLGTVLFLWDYLKIDSLEKTGVLALIFTYKFVFDFFLEISSSFQADLWGSTRRRVLITGVAINIIPFLIMLTFPLWQADHILVITLVSVGNLFRAASNSLLSGVFDSWAISAEKTRGTELNQSQFFSESEKQMRKLSFFGTFLLVVGVNVLEVFPHAQGALIFWMSVWAIGLLLTVFVLFFVRFQTRGYDSAIHVGERLPLWGVFKLSFRRSILLSWGLYTLIYTIGMLTNYTWPNFMRLAGPKPQAYFFWLVSIFATYLGTKWAMRITRNKSDTSTLNLTVFYALITVLCIGVTFSLFYKGYEDYSFAALVAIIGFFAMRFFFFVIRPLSLKLLHDGIEESNENVRSAVVSCRVSVTSLFIAGVFYLSKPISQHFNLTDAQNTSVLYLLVSALILVVAGLVYGRSALKKTVSRSI